MSAYADMMSMDSVDDLTFMFLIYFFIGRLAALMSGNVANTALGGQPCSGIARHSEMARNAPDDFRNWLTWEPA